MPDTPSITIIKEFTYRGKPEKFSNKYHFKGTTPSGDAAWKALADAIITAEKGTVTAGVRFVGAYGYEAGNEHSVAQIDYTVPPNTVQVGTLGGLSSWAGQAPDTAVWIRAKTPDRNANGKWIYVRKYMHGVYAGPDGVVADPQRAALLTFANKLLDGTLPGSFKWCGPQGAEASAPLVGTYATTRTLKRRGKRPSR